MILPMTAAMCRLHQRVSTTWRYVCLQGKNFQHREAALKGGEDNNWLDYFLNFRMWKLGCVQFANVMIL